MRNITNGKQVILNRVLKTVNGVPQKAPVSSMALWREFNIAPTCAIAAGQRGRALQKRRIMSAWIQRMVINPTISRKWKWASGTSKMDQQIIQKIRGRQAQRCALRIPNQKRVAKVGTKPAKCSPKESSLEP